MSIKIMQLAWTTSLPAPKKLVLLALADNANDEGDCYPSIATISRKCSLSIRAVRYALRDLVSQGHVSRDERSGRSTMYRVHPCTTCTPAQSAPLHDMQPTPARGAPHPGTTCTHNRQSNRQGTLSALHATLPRETWEEWLSHRRDRRWSLSPRALNPQLKLLSAYDPETQREIIETSIQAGWQGLFPPKGRKAKESKWM